MECRIAVITRNWESIKDSMIRSNTTRLGWVLYSRTISNGLSNNQFNKKGSGAIMSFVELLPAMALYADVNIMRIAYNLTDDQVNFISANREFLLSIKH